MNRLVVVFVAVFFVFAIGRAVDAEVALSEREPKAEQTVRSGARLVGALPSAGEPASLSESAAVRAIRQVFPGNARALKVAWCESRRDPRAVSPTGDYGLFQLNRRTWDPARNPRARPYWPRGKDWRHVFDPVVNARVAWAISKRGTDFWTHWRWSARCWA